ncbi:hypothetical protein ABZ023_33600 [Streptomyces sp. NPDC006367]|uniref:hypothetical protein n=1 Tax=unclassified Streptomyces TaxID=2593676 RepID=UPI0033B82698
MPRPNPVRRPESRARWASRHHTRQAVSDVAADLAYLAADGLEEACPAQAPAEVLTQAALAAAADGSSSVGRVLDWLTRHHAPAAETALSAIAEQAELRLGIPRAHPSRPCAPTPQERRRCRPCPRATA